MSGHTLIGGASYFVRQELCATEAPTVVHIDIESFFGEGVGFKTQCTWEYITDPRFYVTAIAARIEYEGHPDGEIVAVFRGPTNNRDAVKYFLKGIGYTYAHTVTAHNGAFDFAALRHVSGLTPKRMYCTLDMDVYLHGKNHHHRFKYASGSLASVYASTVWQLGGEPLEAKNRDALFAMYDKHISDLGSEELASFVEYAAKDVQMLQRIYQAQHPHVPHARRYATHWAMRVNAVPRLMFDHTQAAVQMAEADDKIRQTLDSLGGITADDLRSAKKFGEVVSGLYPEWPFEQMKSGLRPLMRATDPRWKAMRNDPRLPAELHAVMDAKKQVSGRGKDNRIERYVCIASAHGMGDRLPFNVFSSGTRTNRPTGASGSGGNPLNMPKGGIIRNALHAAPGKLLVVADFSSIELRLCRWMCKDEASIAAILQGESQGVDMYKSTASSALGIPIEQVDDDIRFKGKLTELSAQYGTGGAKLAGVLGISEVEGQALVNTFRATRPGVVRAWRTLDHLIRHASLQTGSLKRVTPLLKESFNLPPGTRIAEGYGGLVLTWPSGTEIVWPHIAPNPGHRGFVTRKRFSRFGGVPHTVISDKINIASLYGALMLENWSQGLTAEIMTDRQIALERAHYEVNLNIYDEFILEVDAGYAEREAADIKRIMCAYEGWPEGPPLDVDVKIVERYGDAK